MSSTNIVYFAWNNEDNHDKCWGVVEMATSPDQPTYERSRYSFWAARGKKMRFKRHFGAAGYYECQEKYREKLYKKGYNAVPVGERETVWPSLMDELKMYFIQEKFAGKILSDEFDEHSFI